MKILIIGDSHTGALNGGLRHLTRDEKLPPDVSFHIQGLGWSVVLQTPFFNDAGDHVELVNEGYRSRMPVVPPPEEHYDMIGLSMPLFPLRLLRDLLPKGWGLAEWGGDWKPMSRAVFRELVLKDLHYILRFLETLQRHGHKVFAVAGPGLFKSHLILQYVSDEQGVQAFNLYKEIALEELSRRNCPVVLPPASSYDSEGFMKQGFRHPDPKDPHHAGSKFGIVMLEAILERANEILAEKAAP